MAQGKMKPVSITYLYQSEEAKKVLDGITLAAVQQNVKEQESPPTYQTDKDVTEETESDNQVVHTVSDKMECMSCLIKFEDRNEQIEHYKSDWHRFNLKQKLKELSTVSEDQFEEIAGGDLSSISGSESEDNDSSGNQDDSIGTVIEDEEDETSVHVEGIGRRHPRVFFRNSQGELVSIYRCVLHSKKIRAGTPEELLDLAEEMPLKMKWAVLLTAGGHFAGAILQGESAVAHKTFHRYVVRAKRGTVQSIRDRQGNAPKSGGASLRRYNEAALTQEIQELLVSWKEELNGCDRIFIKYPSYNRNLYFSGKNSPLERNDPRVRQIPFVTRRPTFSELKRVHESLAAINCYGAEGNIEDHIKTTPKKVSPNKTQPQQIKLGKERKAKGQTMEEVAIDSSDQEETDIVLEMENLSVDFSELKEFEGTKKPRRKKKTKDKSQNGERSSTSKADVVEDTPAEKVWFNEKQYKLRNSLYSACKMCDLDLLEENLRRCNNEPSANNDGISGTPDKEEVIVDKDISAVLNESFGDQKYTLLHIVAAAGFSEAVEILLEAGCDPSIMDAKRMVPYIAAKDKETRHAFRRFMGKCPEKYDYVAAKIPGPLTAEMESAKRAKEAERRKAQKKARKEKMKEKKDEEKKQREEDREKHRYLSLSDREKRALAAERRLVSQMQSLESPAPCLSRCFQCGADITGKVPFEYSDNRFCSPKCLKEHRFNTKPK